MNAPQFIGSEPVLEDLDVVSPNHWNPNTMSAEMFESLKQGLQKDGWPWSEPLFIWGKDEHGHTKNVIIDGEHRWKAAKSLGLIEGPMTFATMTESDAKAWTIKLDQKRGTWNEGKLSALIKHIQAESDGVLEARDFGFEDDHLARMLAEKPEPLVLPPPPETPEEKPADPLPNLPVSAVRVVQLFLDDKSQPEFVSLVRKIGVHIGKETVTEVVLAVIREKAEELGGAEKDNPDPDHYGE